jgi:transposase-like protein
MAQSVLSVPHFQSEEAAFEYVESKLWPNGPTCPHCGNADAARIGRLQGKTTRPGLRKCYECKKPFTVRQGTVFESSHLALHLWLQAIHLMCAGKKGVATRELQRMLQCSMKTAWFLGHRIREALDDSGTVGPMGGFPVRVEMDETYVGGKEMNKHRSKRKNVKGGSVGKAPVFALVERGGRVRATHLPTVSAANLNDVLDKNLRPGSVVFTDEFPLYNHLKVRHRPHGTINHRSGEYVRGEVHTNTVEGFFSILKRGINGVYHSVSQHHLQRYLSEFGFRYNEREALGVDDVARAERALIGAKGKRLTYATTARTSEG